MEKGCVVSVDADLATLRDAIEDALLVFVDTMWERAYRNTAPSALKGVGAELSRLNELVKQADDLLALYQDRDGGGEPGWVAELSRLREQVDSPTSDEIAESALWLDAVSEAFPDFDFSGCYDFDDLRKHMIGQVSRLREERDALYEANWPWEWVIATREKERRQAAEARCALLQQALRDGVRVAAQYMDTGRGDLDGWIAQAEALAGPDAQTSGSGSSAADPSVGERQGRQPDPGEIAGLLVELSRWSRVAELNGDLHARIASALAGLDA